MRHSILLAILAMTLVVPPLADATVRKQSFTGTVRAGDEATLTVSVSPRARCGIKVVYDTVTSGSSPSPAPFEPATRRR